MDVTSPTTEKIKMELVLDSFKTTLVAKAHAPVRTADLGGWTDTWFAIKGHVCSVAVEPGVLVEAFRYETDSLPSDFLFLELSNRSFAVFLSNSESTSALDIVLRAALTKLPPPYATHIRISSLVPAGSGMGTSAAVSVALLATLFAIRGQSPDALELAYAAHHLEADNGLQSGVQDQFASVYGGVNFFDIQYPHLEQRKPVENPSLLSLLNDRLVTFYLGCPHSSSDVHTKVIRHLEGKDNHILLDPLRTAANEAFSALSEANLSAYGQALVANNHAQENLSQFLINDTARQLIAIAKKHGARGWKVNGAGGDGGSIAILGPEGETQHQEMVAELSEQRRVSPPAALSGVTGPLVPGDKVCLLQLKVAVKGVSVTMHA